MTDDIVVIDAETAAALKVLRGDNKKNPNAVDKEFSSGLAKQIVDALSTQTETSSNQTAELISAVREQTAALQKLTDLLSSKQKATVVVVNKDKEQSSSVASTAGETEETEEAGNKQEEAQKEETQKEAATKVAEPEEEKLPGPTRGPWAFTESSDAKDRRNRVNKTNGEYLMLKKGEEIPENAFVPVDKQQKLKKGDALFGTVSGDNQLIGDSFGVYWDRMRSGVNQYGKLQPPLWAPTAKKSVRSYLPTLTIGGKKTIKLDTGVYYLTVKYEQATNAAVEAAIVIGEIAFDNTGYVLAPGAKWTKILKGEKQKEGRTPPSKSKWYTAKISEHWRNGDILRFKIDTNTKTIVYTQTAAGDDEEAKAGWRFENILAFTSVPTYPRDLHAFAYCGGRGRISDSAVKLTIVDETMKDSTSTIADDKPKEAAPVKPEAEVVAEPKEAAPVESEPEPEPKPEAVAEPKEAAPVESESEPEPKPEAVEENADPKIETPVDIMAETDAEVGMKAE